MYRYNHTMADNMNGDKNKNGNRCQNCSHTQDKLVWIEAKYGKGTIGGYVCLKCAQGLEMDATLSNFNINWDDVKSPMV